MARHAQEVALLLDLHRHLHGILGGRASLGASAAVGLMCVKSPQTATQPQPPQTQKQNTSKNSTSPSAWCSVGFRLWQLGWAWVAPSSGSFGCLGERRERRTGTRLAEAPLLGLNPPPTSGLTWPSSFLIRFSAYPDLGNKSLSVYVSGNIGGNVVWDSSHQDPKAG